MGGPFKREAYALYITQAPEGWRLAFDQIEPIDRRIATTEVKTVKAAEAWIMSRYWAHGGAPILVVQPDGSQDFIRAAGPPNVDGKFRHTPDKEGSHV